MLQLARVNLCERVDHLVKCECEQHWPASRRTSPLTSQGPLESAGYPWGRETYRENVLVLQQRPRQAHNW